MKSLKLSRCWKRDKNSISGIKGNKYDHKGGNLILRVGENPSSRNRSSNYKSCVIESKDKSFIKNQVCEFAETESEIKRKAEKQMGDFTVC